MSSWRDELTRRLEPLHLRPERELEILEELSQHLDDRVHELVAGGATPEAARTVALADLDEPEELLRRLAAIEARSPYRLPPPGAPARGRWLAAVWQDIRYSVRSLRRTPGFTLTVVAALALTIGPTTAILSVGNWLLWRPIPGVAEPDRLAVVWFGEWTDRDGGGVSFSPSDVADRYLEDLRRSSSSIDAIAGWQEVTVSLAADGVPPRRVGAANASAGFFGVLGVRPIAGRAFTAADDVPPFGSPVAVVSYRLASGAFGGPDAALGQPIVLNGRALTVVGVLPPGFAGTRPYSTVDVWFPGWTFFHVHHSTEEWMARRAGPSSGVFYTFVVRLAPDATFERLQAELDVLVPALAEQHPDEAGSFRTVRARVFPRLGPGELVRRSYRRLMTNLLLAGAVLVLLGCANVANLLMARSASRQGERAVRLALGASRRRLLQFVLTESCVLAACGAATGAVAAIWLKEILQALLLPGLATSGAGPGIPMDLRVLVTTLLLALGCGLAAGLVPAWTGAFSPAGSGLPHADRRTSAARARLRSGFAVVQLALSLALVVNAALLVGTLRHLAAVDLGFNPTGVSVHHLDLGAHGYQPDRAMAYDGDLLARLSAVPALEAVSISSNYPFGSGHRVRLHDPNASDAAPILIQANYVTEDYFRVLGIPLARGRTFGRAETMGGAPLDGSAAVVDERLARQLFGDRDPLGQRIGVPGQGDRGAHHIVVVGVVRDSRRATLTGEPEPMLYLPFAYGRDYASTRPVILVRSGLPLREVSQIVEAGTRALDATLPVGLTRPLTESVASELSGRRTFASVLSLLGGLGFVLAAVGLYGLLAQMVGERTREFGIRMAIGADRTHVFGLVLRQAVWIAVLGGAAGLGLAALGSRVVESQLVGVSPLEPWVYGASALSLVVIVVSAALWPARVATRIEPVEALRAE